MTKSGNLARRALSITQGMASEFVRKAIIAAWMGMLMMGTTGVRSKELDPEPVRRSADTLASEMLEAHNSVRTNMKLPLLQWSGKLAAYSQQWANTLVARNRFGHNPNSPYGENIFVNGPGTSPKTVVMEWASESRDYTYGTNTCATNCGHYTQLVWRDTQRVGCAVARNARREIWVCSYDPPGNYVDEWPY